jgi:hypothetical protein
VQAPLLLTFFIVSITWAAVSFALLRLGGEAPVSLGTALVLPTALLGFVRPISLPYSWAAPPEPLEGAELHLSVVLVFALMVYHVATLMGARGLRQVSPYAPSEGTSASYDTGQTASLSTTELVGPSLRL